MKTIISLCLLLALAGCKKDAPGIADNPTPTPGTFISYTISAGTHYCDKSSIQAVSLTEMNFKIRFDSSAVYQTKDPANQKDINKLYGFSEGADNHVNSARIGWNWNESALRLYAYTYANSVRNTKELAILDIGAEIICSIRVSGNEYILTAGKNSVAMPRALKTAIANGYQQFPYFGGDEVAPNDIRVYIQDIR